ncbi:MAG: 7-carboxy-7-deazaguanine synthase QueE [Micavibrio sp.]|nr:7-carboxy-7-deazaguanine synthase QueE [Micavibrio sp.]|tara:strand:- start:421 stop:1143 length:723 start_codon:yes stop_codon:yes gene_type:complete
MSESSIRISEIFGPTIQGEGPLIGRPTVFVRTGGCDYRCSWCDTLHAVESEYRQEWTEMSAAEIMDEVQRLSNNTPMMITLSGGNPAIQPMEELIKLGKELGYEFAMETQGSVSKKWMQQLDVLILSPKPPSSKMDTDWIAFYQTLQMAGFEKAYGPDIALKFVVFDEDDYKYAREASARHPHFPVYLQPGNHKVEGAPDISGLMERMRWIIERAANDNWNDVTILPQLHVLIWGNEKGV